jgi:hypothetical protein
MEIDNTKNGSRESIYGSVGDDTLHVRAIITCPNGDYKKTFRNQFLRKNVELMVVSLKIFDWMVCNRCGELLNLNLEFKI